MKRIALNVVAFLAIALPSAFSQGHHHERDYGYEDRNGRRNRDDYDRYEGHRHHRKDFSVFEIHKLRIKEQRRNQYVVEICGEGPKHTKMRSEWRGNTFFVYLDSEKNCHRQKERDFSFDINVGRLPRHGHFQVIVIDNDIDRKIGELEF